MGSCCEILGEMSGSLLLAVCLGLISVAQCGLLGAGTGHGSCPAFPNRSDDIDHVGGCPRYAECCTEFGYCHPLDSREKGYFRDCNGKSNGQPLPGSVIKLEAEQAALGSSSAITAEFLGFTQEIWQKQVKRATSLLSVSSSSSSSSSSSTSSVQDSSFSQSRIPRSPHKAHCPALLSSSKYCSLSSPRSPWLFRMRWDPPPRLYLTQASRH